MLSRGPSTTIFIRRGSIDRKVLWTRDLLQLTVAKLYRKWCFDDRKFWWQERTADSLRLFFERRPTLIDIWLYITLNTIPGSSMELLDVWQIEYTMSVTLRVRQKKSTICDRPSKPMATLWRWLSHSWRRKRGLNRLKANNDLMTIRTLRERRTPRRREPYTFHMWEVCLRRLKGLADRSAIKNTILEQFSSQCAPYDTF